MKNTRIAFSLLVLSLAGSALLAPGLIAATGALPEGAAGESTGGVYVIFDASGSMWGQLADKTHKIEAAREVLADFVAGEFGDRELALRAYGHNREGDCADTELVVPFSPAASAAPAMQAFTAKVNPKGKTPISRSLRAALSDFGDRPGEIILISDGIETCDEDPCELVREWMENNIQIKVHVVGLGLGEKEKIAMQCISEAAGTEYQDAGSTSELAAGLAKIHQSTIGNAFLVRAVNRDGESMRVEGTATPSAGEGIEVASHKRHDLPAGEYRVTVGIRTRNGSLYRPVTETVQVSEQGETVLSVVIEEPPSVQAKFYEKGEERSGSNVVYAYENDQEAFTFRWMDRVYVDPGTYQFRAKPNAENDLTVTATIAEGEHREIVFELAHTVHATIKVVAAGSGLDFRQNYELWQGGEKVKSVHWNNGVWATPGTYELRVDNSLTPFVHPGLVLTEEDRQDFRIEVPVGHVTVIYQKPDGSRDDDARVWIKRWNGEKWLGHKTQTAGQAIPLPPGKYRAEGWNHRGKSYQNVEFEIAVDEQKEIALRDQG